jgi:rubrerythrin
MIEQAVTEGDPAKRMFNFAAKAEAVHAKLYAMALEGVKQGKDLTEVEFYLCPVCGNIEFGKAPKACPICGGKGANFVRV